MKKIKAVIKDLPRGTKYSVYEKKWWGWSYSHGYIPLDSCFFLFDGDIVRLKKVYGDDFEVINNSKIYSVNYDYKDPSK
jgi:hypothetical protein